MKDNNHDHRELKRFLIILVLLAFLCSIKQHLNKRTYAPNGHETVTTTTDTPNVSNKQK